MNMTFNQPHSVQFRSSIRVGTLSQLFWCMQGTKGLFLHKFSNRKSKIYKCDERDVFIRNCIKEMESMDPQQVASTFLSFLQRWALSCAGVEATHTAISSTWEEVQITVIIVCGIFCRHDFDVQFDSKNSTSVFELLQEACLQMSKISHDMRRKATGAKQSQQQLYQRFVYSRFMWGECE